MMIRSADIYHTYRGSDRHPSGPDRGSRRRGSGRTGSGPGRIDQDTGADTKDSRVSQDMHCLHGRGISRERDIGPKDKCLWDTC